MKVLKADHQRRLRIPGVPEPVLRPVDIDKSTTGFRTLRSLRIYRFDAGSAIDGHAEEDEVLIILLAGSIELTLIDEKAKQTFTLSAVGEGTGAPCAAYLPPLAGYHLVALTGAEVAYARATPAEGPPPRVFHANEGSSLWEELTYPRLLRARILKITAGQEVSLLSGNEGEALIHVRSSGVVAAGEESLHSWDTLAVTPGESPTLRVVDGPAALALVLFVAGSRDVG